MAPTGYSSGGVLGKIISGLFVFFEIMIFAFVPALYVVHAAYENIMVFGASVTLSAVSLLVIALAMGITAEET